LGGRGLINGGTEGKRLSRRGKHKGTLQGGGRGLFLLSGVWECGRGRRLKEGFVTGVFLRRKGGSCGSRREGEGGGGGKSSRRGKGRLLFFRGGGGGALILGNLSEKGLKGVSMGGEGKCVLSRVS